MLAIIRDWLVCQTAEIMLRREACGDVDLMKRSIEVVGNKIYARDYYGRRIEILPSGEATNHASYERNTWQPISKRMQDFYISANKLIEHKPIKTMGVLQVDRKEKS